MSGALRLSPLLLLVLLCGACALDVAGPNDPDPVDESTQTLADPSPTGNIVSGATGLQVRSSTSTQKPTPDPWTQKPTPDPWQPNSAAKQGSGASNDDNANGATQTGH